MQWRGSLNAAASLFADERVLPLATEGKSFVSGAITRTVDICLRSLDDEPPGDRSTWVGVMPIRVDGDKEPLYAVCDARSLLSSHIQLPSTTRKGVSILPD